MLVGTDVHTTLMPYSEQTWDVLYGRNEEPLAEGVFEWNSQFRHLIVLFHSLGLFTAYAVRNRFKYHHSTIALLFVTSYALLFFGQNMLLAMVYPFVISYYNFFLLRLLVSIRSLQLLGVCMLGAGWIASGLGLMVALNHLMLLIILI